MDPVATRMSWLPTRESMYWASKSVCSRDRMSHLICAETSFVSSEWLKSRVSFWKYRPSRVVAQVKPGPQSLTKGTPGIAEPVLMASWILGELLPAQLPCPCVRCPDCSMPLEPNTRPEEPARIELPRGSKAGVP